MNKLHLCLICGRDNRYYYIKHTIEAVLPVFDVIHIMDTGSTDRTPRLADVSSKINYFHWDNWHLGWGDAYDQVRRDVPDGDWFLYLDSDEIPSQYLLNHIHPAVSRIEQEGYGQARIPNVLHLNGFAVGQPARELPRSVEEFIQNDCWTKHIICQNSEALIVNHRGMHAGFKHTQKPTTYLPLYYCHHKTSDQVDASISICSFLVPESHGLKPGTQEHTALRQLADRYDIRTNNQLVALVQENPPPELVSLISAWKDHEKGTCRHWYAWWQNNFQVGGYPLNLCNDQCCRYDHLTSVDCEVLPGSIPSLRSAWSLKIRDDKISIVSKGKKRIVECDPILGSIIDNVAHGSTVAGLVNHFVTLFPEKASDIPGDVVSTIESLVKHDILSTRSTSRYIPRNIRQQVELAVDEELAYWKSQAGWDRERMLEDARNHEALVLDFKGGWVEGRWNGGPVGRNQKLLPYMQRVAMDNPDLVGMFLINTHDAVRPGRLYPVVGFSKRGVISNGAVLIPDLYFINGHRTTRREIPRHSKNLPWSVKLNKAIWRGSPTGQANTIQNWQANVRIKLCQYSKKNPDIIDAALSAIGQCDDASGAVIRGAELVGQYLTAKEQMVYKYLVNVDGNSASWGGTFWKLMANCLMIQVERGEPGTGYSLWFSRWLKSGYHYLSCNLDDLGEVLEWAINHDGECKNIAHRGTAFANEYLNEEVGMLYTGLLLKKLSALEPRPRKWH